MYFLEKVGWMELTKIKTTSMTIYGDDFQNQDTELKLCNAVHEKILTSTKTEGSLNDPRLLLGNFWR